LKRDTFNFSDLDSILQIVACAPTLAAARSLCENQNLRGSPGLVSAASAAVKLYERLPFLTAAAAHVDAEVLNLWQLTGLMSRRVYCYQSCFLFSVYRLQTCVLAWLNAKV
jgi:hypothetical protein